VDEQGRDLAGLDRSIAPEGLELSSRWTLGYLPDIGRLADNPRMNKQGHLLLLRRLWTAISISTTARIAVAIMIRNRTALIVAFICLLA
jgi:hypothetical protein